MKRGEIWWAELPAPAGRHPVLLLSRDESYAVRELVTVAPVTSRIRDIPTEVPLNVADGLPKSCVVNLDTVATIAKACLREKLTTLRTEKLRAVEIALHFALGMDN